MADSERQAVLDALKRGDIAAAESLCETYLRSGGGAEGLYLMGAIHSIKGDKTGALRLMERAAALQPDRADIAYNLGVARRETGELAGAAKAWRRTLEIDPQQRDAHANLALALDHMGDAAGSVEAYRTLLEQWPDDRDGLYNFANLSQRAGELAAAKPLYARLLAKHAGFVPGWINQGMLAKRERDWDGAEASYRRAVALDPGNAAAHFNLANLLLTRGRWSEGFEEYEWRLAVPGAPRPKFDLPDWTGTEPAGTRVLLWGDQGYGDAIQFIRFAPLVAARGHRVLVIVKEELRTLAATALGVEAAFGPEGPLPEADVQLSLASLPHRLVRHDPKDFWTGLYLGGTAPESRGDEAPRSIGLVWAGDPRHPNDANRSARLADLAPLLDVPNVAWVNLQLGPASAQANEEPWADRMAAPSPTLTDFAASAAAVHALDLVITVDTSMAHLVGALGWPGLVMLPSVDCDWRWLDTGEVSPWYPTLRLFRESKPQDWAGVAMEIARYLTATATSRPTR